MRENDTAGYHKPHIRLDSSVSAPGMSTLGPVAKGGLYQLKFVSSALPHIYLPFCSCEWRGIQGHVSEIWELFPSFARVRLCARWCLLSTDCQTIIALDRYCILDCILCRRPVCPLVPQRPHWSNDAAIISFFRVVQTVRVTCAVWLLPKKIDIGMISIRFTSEIEHGSWPARGQSASSGSDLSPQGCLGIAGSFVPCRGEDQRVLPRSNLSGVQCYNCISFNDCVSGWRKGSGKMRQARILLHDLWRRSTGCVLDRPEFLQNQDILRILRNAEHSEGREGTRLRRGWRGVGDRAREAPIEK
eukprot:gene65-biopygen133